MVKLGCTDWDEDGDSNATDCAPNNPAQHHGAQEICDDGIDNDCNGLVDAADPACRQAPPDGDGDGDPDVTDCSPNDPAIHHGAQEICDDGIDNDCNGLVDAADPACRQVPPVGQLLTYYRDADGDGFGDGNSSVQAADAPAGFVTDNTDCDDGNAGVHPGAAEICSDGVDNNCDGSTDGADPACGCGMCGVGSSLMMPFTTLGWIALQGFSRRRCSEALFGPRA